MKNSNDNIGNRTHDLPTCSAVPQPTAPPRTPNLSHNSQTNQSLNCSSNNISKARGVKLGSEQLYEHVPKSEETNHEGKLTVFWTQQVQTNKTIPNN
jgi:hypothetical protein